MENIEKAEIMEKMENINQMILNTLFMIKNTVFVTQNTRMTQNTLFYGFSTVKKIIACALGEHDPGSPQNGRTSSEM